MNIESHAMFSTMFKFANRLLAVALLLSSVAVNANTPPLPPPDPDRLAAAVELVERMPIEAVMSGYNSQFAIRADLTGGASAWLRRQPDMAFDETLNRLFLAKVELAAQDEMSAAVAGALPAIAENYARRLSQDDLEAASAFIETEAGTRFMTMQLDSDRNLLSQVSQELYRRIALRLPDILRAAEESRDILNEIQ